MFATDKVPYFVVVLCAKDKLRDNATVRSRRRNTKTNDVTVPYSESKSVTDRASRFSPGRPTLSLESTVSLPDRHAERTRANKFAAAFTTYQGSRKRWTLSEIAVGKTVLREYRNSNKRNMNTDIT